MNTLSRHITLRKAKPDDLPLLKHWDEQPHVIAADPNDDWDWENQLALNADWQEMFIAELDEHPLGFIQIIDPAHQESHYWGEIEEGYRAIDIWIGEEKDLGKGYGTEMMRQVLDHCFKNPEVHAFLIDPLESNTNAHRFYERLGFEFLEKRRFNEDDCFVYMLKKEEWNTQEK